MDDKGHDPTLVPPAEGPSHDPVALDAHRGMAAQKATEIRRLHSEVQADHAALRQHQAELEASLLAAPATTWPEAAAKARYLIQLFAATQEAQDSRHQQLIASVLDDFLKLSGEASPPP